MYSTIAQYLNLEQDKTMIDRIMQRPSLFLSLPFKEITIGSTQFSVFGMNHGQLPQHHIISRLSRPLVRSINSMMSGSHRPSEGVELFCEEGFSYLFDIDPVHEIDDSTNSAITREIKVRLYDKHADPYRMAKNLIPDLMDSFKLRRQKDKFNATMISYISNMALSSMYYQGKTGEIEFECYMREPLNLEIKHVMDMTDPSEIPEDMPKRSLYTAHRLLDTAEKKGLRQVNYFAGLSHVAPIIYFLENPGYDFTELDYYIDEGFYENL